MKNKINIAAIFFISIFLLNCSKNEDELQSSDSLENTEIPSPHLKSAQVQFIDNNSVWNDVDGNEIKAQGGCIIQEGSTFHWFGPQFESTDYNFRAINHYTSTDLKSWTKQTPALTPSSPGMSSIPIYSTSWVGRPWVMKHGTNDYVMWIELGKLSGSSYRNRYGVFYASSLSGTWTFARAYESLPDASGTQYGLGDLGAYHDASTGNAYILYSFDKNETNGCQAIVKLSSDFRSVLTPAQGGFVAEFPKSGYYCKEAAAIFKRGSTYYHIMSETRGWRPSNTWYRTATSIGDASVWSALTQASMDPTGDAYSFRTQHDFVLPITGSLGTTYVYCGDRWSIFGTNDYNGAVGRQAWFPLSFDSSGNITINAPNFSSNGGDWYLDVPDGTWSATPPSNQNLVVNGDFSNDYSSWTTSGPASITTVAAEIHSSPKASNSYSSSAYTTTISNSSATNCAAGTYTAKVWSRSKVVTYTYRKFEVFVNGTKTNELTMGTNTSAPASAWTQFDDFTLVKN
jgi:hypothetical protein